MSQMVDGEGTGDGHVSITNEEHVNAQGGLSSSTKSLTKAAPDTTVPITIIDAALVSLPVSKQSQPPKILPTLNVSRGDTLVKEEGCEQELQRDIHSQLNVGTNVRPPGALQNINPEMVSAEQKEAVNTPNAAASTAPTLLGVGAIRQLVMWTTIIGGGAVAGATAFIVILLRLLNCVRGRLMGMGKLVTDGGAVDRPNAAAPAGKVTLRAWKSNEREMVLLRLRYLQNQQQPRRKDFSSDYIQNLEDFIAKLEVSSLDEILSKEMNSVFLQKLLDHILIPDAEEVTMSPSLTNSTPTSDPVLDALAAAPSCHRRANAHLHALILDDAGEDAMF